MKTPGTNGGGLQKVIFHIVFGSLSSAGSAALLSYYAPWPLFYLRKSFICFTIGIILGGENTVNLMLKYGTPLARYTARVGAL